MLDLQYEDKQIDLSVSSRDILSNLRDAVYSLHGDFGLACVMRSLAGW